MNRKSKSGKNHLKCKLRSEIKLEIRIEIMKHHKLPNKFPSIKPQIDGSQSTVQFLNEKIELENPFRFNKK